MFEKDYTLHGKHATYTKFLVHNAKLFERHIDVYMNGAVFGLLYDKHVPRDRESNDTANILAEVFSKTRIDCVLLYRLTMLLDKNSGLNENARIDRAFRDDADTDHPEKLQANMEIFHSYVRGGIEVIYEQLVEGSGNNPDEYLEHAMEIMERFKEELDGSNFADDLDAVKSSLNL